jgi:hypothetical protein
MSIGSTGAGADVGAVLQSSIEAQQRMPSCSNMGQAVRFDVQH